MSDKFQDKYRIPSARADWWDYGWNAAYFVTICTAHREHYFGEIVVETGQCPVSTNPANPIMQLSEIEKLAEFFWWSIPEHFPFAKLDAFVVIPNHIHGILVIDKLDDETNPTQNPNFTSEQKTPGELRFRNQGKHSLSSIIGSYKSIITKHAHRIHADFEWQDRFYDHIIRDEEEFSKIANYIENNVVNWQDDQFYP